VFNIFQNETPPPTGLIQFSLDGAPDAGFVKSVSGGYVKGEVAAEQAGPNFRQFKHVATIDIEPIKLELAMALSGPMMDWIGDSWRRGYSRRNGHVAHGDFSGNSRIEQWFKNALLVETGFPALDASSKESLFLNCTILPEQLEIKEGSGMIGGSVSPLQKQWQANNFNVDIDGINTDGLVKVDAFTVKQKHKKFHYGAMRYAEIEPTGLEFPTFTMYSTIDCAHGFYDWHEKYVIKGHRDTEMEKDGEIQFLSPSGDILMTVSMRRIGITGVSIEKSEAMGDKLKLVKIEMFVEDLELYEGMGLE
jgi:hypothetical protein